MVAPPDAVPGAAHADGRLSRAKRRPIGSQSSSRSEISAFFLGTLIESVQYVLSGAKLRHLRYAWIVYFSVRLVSKKRFGGDKFGTRSWSKKPRRRAI